MDLEMKRIQTKKWICPNCSEKVQSNECRVIWHLHGNEYIQPVSASNPKLLSSRRRAILISVGLVFLNIADQINTVLSATGGD